MAEIQWLIRKKGESVKAHIWNKENTRCRLFGNSGLKIDKYEFRTDRGDYDICFNCMMNYSPPPAAQLEHEKPYTSPTARKIPSVKELLERYGPEIPSGMDNA